MSNDLSETHDAVDPVAADPTDTPDGPDAPTPESEAASAVEVSTSAESTDVADDEAHAEDAVAGLGEDEDDAGAAEETAGPRAGGSDRRRQLEREGEVAADFLETLLDICDLDGDLDVDIDGDRAAVAIVDSDEGRVPRRLVGNDGQVLEALQELTRLAVQSETGERSRLMLDVAGHRAERRATLVSVAKEAIEEVRASGERKSLTPMTAFERKVVHDEVLAAGLVSESEGAEPRRFVVILPA
jgi:spoIIIJ-associated protein